MLCSNVALSLPCWPFSTKLRQPTGQRQSNVRMQQTNFLIGPILFLYYEESLVSSNLNSKLFSFHCVWPKVHVLYLYAYRALKCNYVVILNVTIALNCRRNMCHEFQHEHIQFGKFQTATTIQSYLKPRKNEVEEL